MNETILFDASRLLSRTERSAPTGVDRVCLAYAEWLLARDDLRVVPVRNRHDQLVEVDFDWFSRSIDKLRACWTGPPDSAPDTRRDRLFSALQTGRTDNLSLMDPPPEAEKAPKSIRRPRVWKQFLRSRPLVRIPANAWYFNVGHTSLNTPKILSDLNRYQVRSVVLLHDLIPITHPEFCRPGDDEKHRQRVLTTLAHASRIIVNSEHTARELFSFARAEGLEPPQIDAVHLGLEPVFTVPEERPSTRPYFVHVGTIEARKNLAFLLAIWRRLEESMGIDTPQLVLVGRYGWENEAVLDYLQRSPNLKGRVHQISNLSDMSLARLMTGAQAVLAPSSVEGFDLPAVEACALRVPLIASDIAAHRELVPQAHLIDPLDGIGWLEALKTATRTRPSTHSYQAPSWPDHFDRISQIIGISPSC